jgi:cytochrome P450
MFGPNSLLLLSGERHGRDRKLLGPPFHGERVRAHGEAVRRAARRHTSGWAGGQTRSVQDATQAISLDVIVETVFGAREAGRRAEIREAILETMGHLHPIGIYMRNAQMEAGAHAAWAKFDAAKARLDSMLLDEVRRRRSDPAPGDDILSLMLSARYDDGSRLSDEELRQEMVTMLMAGHETTSIALAWAIYRLQRRPDALARLRTELDALAVDVPAADLFRAPYLAAVCDETLRMDPIIPDISRELAQDGELAGMQVRAGQILVVAISEVHRDPTIFSEPDRFEPARFIERRFRPWEYLPFGGGHRRCLGAAFASFEMRVALATIVRDWELELADDRQLRPVRRNITMGPEGGVPVRVLGRR